MLNQYYEWMNEWMRWILPADIGSFLGGVLVSCVRIVVGFTRVACVSGGVVSACVLAWCAAHVGSIGSHGLLICVGCCCGLFIDVVCCFGGARSVYDLWIRVVGVPSCVDDSRLLLLNSVSSRILASRVSYLVSVIHSWARSIGCHSVSLECLVGIMNNLSTS